MQRRAPRTLNFTKAAIESLAAPEGSREYHYDQKIPGLACCVTPAGTKTFYVVRRVERRVEFIRVGGWPEVTVEQARTEASRINGEVADGVNPGEQRRQANRARTLGEEFDAYLLLPARTKEKRPRSPKTLHDYKLQFAAYLEHWRDRRLSQITRQDVEALHNDLGSRCGHFAANRTLGLLKSLYNAAIDEGFPGVNPAARVRKFEERSRKRFLQADELPKFWAALEAEPSEKIRDFIKLCLLTGQRRGNVLAMKWADVNLERGVWTMPHTKTGEHEIPLIPAALEILNRRKLAAEQTEYVLPGLHGRGHLKDPMRQWRSILAAAGIGDLRIHDLRRSMGSWQTMTGSNTATVGATLGHTQAQTTAIYSRVPMATVRDSMGAAVDAMMAATKGPKASQVKRQAKGK